MDGRVLIISIFSFFVLIFRYHHIGALDGGSSCRFRDSNQYGGVEYQRFINGGLGGDASLDRIIVRHRRRSVPVQEPILLQALSFRDRQQSNWRRYEFDGRRR